MLLYSLIIRLSPFYDIYSDRRCDAQLSGDPLTCRPNILIGVVCLEEMT